MPNYISNPSSTFALYPGDTAILFNAEQPGAGQASMEVALPPNPAQSGQAQLHFSIAYTSATTSTLTVQIANDDNDAAFFNTTTTSGSKQNDQFDFATNAQFVRISQSAQSGGNLTVKVRRIA